MNDKTKKDYIQDPSFCPICGSNDISAGKSFPDLTSLFQEVECLYCHATWNDIYTLTDMEIVCVPDLPELQVIRDLKKVAEKHGYKLIKL